MARSKPGRRRDNGCRVATVAFIAALGIGAVAPAKADAILVFDVAGKPTRKQIAEIRRISLQKLLESEGEVTVYSCALTFDDGNLLRVTSKTAMLEPPGSRNTAYRDFVHAF